jgi:myo-inositol catabolism protein IolS
MKKLGQDGKVRSVGVSNFNLKRLKAAQEALAPVELASNQVKYNLLDRDIETDLLPYAQKEKVTIIAYSPLAQGILTGKYTANSKPGSFVQKTNARFSKSNLNRLTPLFQALSEVAQADHKTPSQVALNWLISKENVVAIPGAKTPGSVTDNAEAADWRLDDLEVARLKSLASGTKFDQASGIPNLLKALTRL